VATLIVGLVGILLAVRGGSVASLFEPVESRIADAVSRRLVAIFESANPTSGD
jgi:hypothetical protein